MKEIQKYKQIIEESKQKKDALLTQIKDAEKDIALNEIEYTNMLQAGNMAEAERIRDLINGIKTTISVKEDMLKLLNENHITDEIKKQADKTVEEAITNIKRIKKEASPLYKEYEQKQKELNDIVRKMKGYNSQLDPYIKVCNDIGKDFPYYAKEHDAFHDSNNLPNRKPSISFRYKTKLSLLPFVTMDRDYSAGRK